MAPCNPASHTVDNHKANPAPPLDTILQFIHNIGLTCRLGTVPEKTFMPGITLENGDIVYDLVRLKHPGDLLHEAGHLAVMPPERRQHAQHDAGKFAAEEMMAIAWSYAALLHLKLDPEVVFHEEGYRGASRSIIDNFQSGHYFGVPMLVWLAMTQDPNTTDPQATAIYPAMLNWIRN